MKEFTTNADTMATENEGISANKPSNGKPQTPGNKPPHAKKRKPVPKIWFVLGKSRKAFAAQLSKSNDIKRQCIEIFMVAETQDDNKFWADYFDQVEKLLDSRRYIAECKRVGHCPVNIAEHIVFLGSSTISKVLKEGIDKVIGNDIYLYTERLSPEETDMYRSKFKEFIKSYSEPEVAKA